MESKSLNQLQGNPQNPRVMKREDAEALLRSMDEFGDMSGIVYNVSSSQFVGGHQRTSVMKKADMNSNVQITQRFDPATEDGTVALGYVVFGGKQFAYREVAWDLDREMAANIAANKISGDWDDQLLAEALYNLKEQDEELLALTGFDEKEIDKLLKTVSGDDEPGDGEAEEKEPRLAFKITAQQKALIEKTLAGVIAEHGLSGSDEETTNGRALVVIVEQYLQEHPDEGVTFAPPEIPTL